MSLRLLLAVSLSLSLLLLGCEGEYTTPAPGEDSTGPAPIAPPPLPPQPGSALVIPIPEGLQDAGAIVTVSRLHESRPAEETVTPVAAGTQEFVVQPAEGEVLAVSVKDRSGALVEAATVPAMVPAWPGGGKPGRELRVPQDYATLQEAVDAAEYGDTVRVAPGTYRQTVRLKSGVRLLGSGAARSILDGGGQPVRLVDFALATNVVVAGFTFRNVGMATGCARPTDVTACSGDWYAAAVYGASTVPGAFGAASGLVTHNVFEQNYIALMLYYRVPAVVRNNLFVGNVHGLVANHFGSELALIANNVFWENGEHAIVSQAGYLDIFNNVIARSRVGVFHQYVQTGRIRCNLFFENEAHSASRHGPPRVELGVDGNFELEPLFENPSQGHFRPRPGSPLIDAGCFEGIGLDMGGTRQDIGAYGGSLGVWP